MRSIFAVVLMLGLAACAPPAPASYPPQVEANFMRGCENRGATQSYCSCVWEKVEAQISPRDFEALERMPAAQRETHPLTRQIAGFAMECQAAPAAAPAQEPPAKP